MHELSGILNKKKNWNRDFILNYHAKVKNILKLIFEMSISEREIASIST